MRPFLIVATIMSVVLVSCLAIFARSCRSWVEEQVMIPNSPWDVVLRVRGGCSALDSGEELIVARNSATGQVVYVTSMDNVGGFHLAVDAANRLVVSLPTVIEVYRPLDKFDSVEVVYEFKAHDSQEGADYRFWLGHHDEPSAVAWCRSKRWSPFYCDPW